LLIDGLIDVISAVIHQYVPTVLLLLTCPSLSSSCLISDKINACIWPW